jgi:hypothetical protein
MISASRQAVALRPGSSAFGWRRLGRLHPPVPDILADLVSVGWANTDDDEQELDQRYDQ